MNYDEKIDIATKRSYKVVKSNEIIQKARYELNVLELKTLSYIFSMIKPTDTINQIYVFSINDYCKVCGIDNTSGNNYSAIKQTLKELRDKSFYLMKPDGTETTVGWIDKVWINKGSGNVKVRLDEDMEQYLIGLFDNYTQYELLSTLPMQSKYSFRIYELLKSYAFTKRHTFDIDELKKILLAEHYRNYKDFRKKVLEVAEKEINEYTDLQVSYEPIYKGRKVIQVKFTIIQKDTWSRYISSNRAIEQLDGQISMFDYSSEVQ